MNTAQKIPTVTIVDDASQTGFVVINESDFDKKTMKLYKAPEPKVEAK